MATKSDVYFCDPQSAWQRGSKRRGSRYFSGKTDAWRKTKCTEIPNNILRLCGGDDAAAALSHQARVKAEAEVMADLLSVERDESFFAWRAQAERLPVEHRRDINPLALRGLRLITAPRAVPSPGTSLEHAISFVGPR